MPNFALPHTFHDGSNETASGAQVSEDLQVLKERIELLENKEKVVIVHHAAEEHPPVGANQKAPVADAVSIQVPAGGALAHVSAAVGLVKSTGADISAWCWPLVSSGGQGLVASTAPQAHVPIVDEVFSLAAQGGPGLVGWQNTGASGAGNIADQINLGQEVSVGGVNVWLPEGLRTIELLYTIAAAGDVVHNRFVAVALL